MKKLASGAATDQPEHHCLSSPLLLPLATSYMQLILALDGTGSTSFQAARGHFERNICDARQSVEETMDLHFFACFSQHNEADMIPLPELALLHTQDT